MLKISDKVVRVEYTAALTETHIARSYEGITIIGSHPKYETVYVVEKIISFPHWGDRYAITLVGPLSCIHNDSGKEVGWDARAFRKLEDIQAENRKKKSCIRPEEQ